MVAGEGYQAAGVLRPDRVDERVVHPLAFLRLRGVLVLEGEDDHRRVVEARAHHRAGLLHLQAEVVGIGHLRGPVAPAERLLPHEYAHLVAVVEEPLALLVVAAAEEVAVDRLQELDVLHHQRLGRGRAELRVRLVPVRALQEEDLAVQPQAFLLRLDLPDAETGNHGRDALLRVRGGRAGARPSRCGYGGRSGARPSQCYRVEVGGGGAPEFEVRHAHGRAEVAERGLDLLRAVEDERRVEVSLREVDGLDLHRARLVVARAHEELPVVEDHLHAVVETAVEVEVVVRQGELLRGPPEHVVKCGEDRVGAGGERTGGDFQLRPREGLDAANGFAVDGELRAQAHAVHDDPGVLDRLGERERAPVEAGAALAQPFGQHVPASGNGHPVRRGEVGAACGLKGLPLRQGELPAAVQVQRLLPRAGAKRCHERKCAYHRLCRHFLISVFEVLKVVTFAVRLAPQAGTRVGGGRGR